MSSRWFGGLGAWWLVALGALMLAGLTKAIGFVLIPAYLMLLYRAVSGHRHPWRQRVLVSLSGAALGLALLGVLYQPFWDGVSTLKVLLTAPGEKFYVNSLGFVLRYRTPEIIHKIAAHFGETGLAWDIGTIGSSMEKWIRNLAEAVAGLIGLILTLRVRDFPSLLRSWAWTLVAYVLIAAMWFWPWYLGWIIPLAALAGPGRLRRTLVLYSAGGMALYGLAPLIPPPIAGWEGYVPLICFGPVALYLTGCTLRDVRERFRRPSRVAQAESTPDGLPAPLAALGRLLGVRRPVPVPAEWAERPPSARD